MSVRLIFTLFKSTSSPFFFFFLHLLTFKSVKMTQESQLHPFAVSWHTSFIYSLLLADRCLSNIWPEVSSLGLQHLEEEFVHGDFALHLDAIKVLHGLGGCLPEQRQGHQQLACPPRVLRMLGALKVLQSLVEGILEPLDGLDVLYVHGVWSKEHKTGGGNELRTFSSTQNRLN